MSESLPGSSRATPAHLLMTSTSDYSSASFGSVRGSCKRVGGTKRTRRGKSYPPHPIAIIQYRTHSERSDSDEELRRITTALTDSTKLYAGAIAQNKQQSANAILMQSLAMQMDELPIRVQARLRTEFVTSVSDAQVTAADEEDNTRVTVP